MTTARRTGSGIAIDSDKVAAELLDLGEVAERARLAAHGLAAPLLALRAGQLDREVARTAAARGADDPEVAERIAARDAHARRSALVAAELGRVRVTPVTPAAGQASLRGRITRSGKPVADAKVVVEAGERTGHACTDAQGGFALALPGDADLILSVRTSDNQVAFRDTAARRYTPGQQAYREIDLDGVRPPCDPGEPPKSVAVPQLVGEKPEAARALLDKAALTLGKAVEAVTDDKQAGLVIAQDPAAGAVAATGSAVAITIGIAAPAPQTVDVPTLVGLTPDNARALLDKAGLKLGKTDEITVATAEVGRVVRQQPAPGVAVAVGSAVDIVVNVAPPKPETVAVPALVGQKPDAARDILAKAGLLLGKVDQTPVRDNVGVIVQQAPAAGTAVAVGRAVDIIVGVADTAGGTVTVPPLAGRTPDEARQLLARARLVLGKLGSAVAGPNDIGRVTAQQPAAGALVPPASAVDIVVGTATTATPVTPVIPVAPPTRPVGGPRAAPVDTPPPGKAPRTKPTKPAKR